MNEDKPRASFEVRDAKFTDEGLVLVCPDEAEAQRAFCEGQMRGQRLRLDGNKLILLSFGKKGASRQEEISHRDND